MKILAICTRNYKGALDFCLPTWRHVYNLKQVTVLTDFNHPDNGLVEYRPWMRPTVDWLEVVGRKVKLIRRYIRQEEVSQFLFMDVDCYLTDDVSEVFDQEFDIGVTRLDHEKSTSTGIIFFNVTPAALHFLDRWEEKQAEYRRKGIGVRPHRQSFSQISFSDILRDPKTSEWLNILSLDGNVYNCEDDKIPAWIRKIQTHNPKVLHFKAERWKNRQIIEQVL